MSAAASGPPAPGNLAFDEAGRPWSPRYRDIYRSRAGAFEEARTVFVDGCRLVQGWRSRQRFTVVELGFGLGVNFLATLAAWRADPQRSQRLDFVSIEAHPLSRSELARAHEAIGATGADAEALRAHWPLALPGLHRLRLADGCVTLTLAIGDAASLAARLPVAADAFFLDGFSPARNPAMWSPGLMKSLARLARPQATLSTYTAAGAVRDALALAGFQLALVPGFGGKRERIEAIYAPRWRTHPAPPAPPAWPWREAIVIGAGLAGTATASALARRGWRVALLERRSAVCAEGSAQPLVADHLHLAPDDNPLARLSRAALLLQTARYPGQAPIGKLQVADTDAEFQRQRASLASLAFPAEFASVLEADAASDLAGVRVRRGGLWLPLCGAVDPLERCRGLLDLPPPAPANPGPREAGACAGDARLPSPAPAPDAGGGDGSIAWRPRSEVLRLERCGELWQALGADGRVLAAAPVVVLANAGEAMRLAAQSAHALRRVRGQTTLLPAQMLGGLRTVLGGDAYACPMPDGGVLVGSTFDDGDSLVPDPEADRSNLRRLARMLAPAVVDPETALLQARAGVCGFRFTARDRLPLIGPLPDEAATRACAAELGRNDRLPLPLMPGVYGAFAFGARGLLWSTLAAEILAATIDGDAPPVETDLLAALAPARFLKQQLRRRQLR